MMLLLNASFHYTPLNKDLPAIYDAVPVQGQVQTHTLVELQASLLPDYKNAIHRYKTEVEFLEGKEDNAENQQKAKTEYFSGSTPPALRAAYLAAGNAANPDREEAVLKAHFAKQSVEYSKAKGFSPLKASPLKGALDDDLSEKHKTDIPGISLGWFVPKSHSEHVVLHEEAEGPGLPVYAAILATLKDLQIVKGVAAHGEVTMDGKVVPVANVVDHYKALKQFPVITKFVTNADNDAKEALEAISNDGPKIVYVNNVRDAYEHFFVPDVVLKSRPVVKGNS